MEIMKDFTAGLLVLILMINNVFCAVSVTCEKDRPLASQRLTCTCKSDSGSDILWTKDGVSIATCLASTGACSPFPSAYEVSNDVSGSIKIFNVTIKSFGYSSCGQYACNGGTSDSKSLTIADFDSSLTPNWSEPPNEVGNISLTTSCFFGRDDFTAVWYIYKDSQWRAYEPNEVTTVTSDSSTCTNTCGTTKAEKIIATFVHTSQTEYIESKLGLKLIHKYYPEGSLPIWSTAKTYKLSHGTATSTSTAIPITSPTSTTTTTHLVTSNTTSSTSTSTTTTATASISTSTTTTTSLKTSTRTTNSTVPTQIVTQSEQDESITVVIVVPSVLGGLFVIGVAVTFALVWKFRKNQTLHSNRSKHHEGHSKKENKERHLKSRPAYSEYIPSYHHGFSAKELHGFKMYSGQSEIKRNPFYSHHLDRHLNVSYVTNRGQYRYDQLYNGNQFLGYQMQSARADPLYPRRGHMIHPLYRYQYSTNPRALRTQDNTILTDYSWNWN